MRIIQGNNKYIMIIENGIIKEPIFLKNKTAIISNYDDISGSLIEEKENINILLDEINKSNLEKAINKIPNINEEVKKDKFYIDGKDCVLCLSDHIKTNKKPKDEKDKFYVNEAKIKIN